MRYDSVALVRPWGRGVKLPSIYVIFQISMSEFVVVECTLRHLSTISQTLHVHVALPQLPLPVEREFNVNMIATLEHVNDKNNNGSYKAIAEQVDIDTYILT